MDGRWRMEVRVEGKCGPLVKNVDEVLRQVQQQLRDQQAEWVAQLRDHPAKFADLEARKSPLLRLEGNKTVAVQNIRPPAKSLVLSAEAMLKNGEGKPVAFVFGPENGPVA